MSARWRAWAWERRLTCADGHHIPNLANIEETGSLRCSKWIAKEGRECGRWIWVLSVRGGGFLVVDVSLEDLRRLKELSTPSERIAYLNIFGEAA
jgi:hypothetical protein